jgi:hypothetical protein
MRGAVQSTKSSHNSRHGWQGNEIQRHVLASSNGGRNTRFLNMMSIAQLHKYDNAIFSSSYILFLSHSDHVLPNCEVANRYLLSNCPMAAGAGPVDPGDLVKLGKISTSNMNRHRIGAIVGSLQKLF